MSCQTCEQAPCTCEPVKPSRSKLPPIYHHVPLQSGPYVTMDEALADAPEQLATLKRLLGVT